MGTGTDHRPRGARWWPAIVIVLLVVAALAWIWGFGPDVHRQARVQNTVIALGLGFLLLVAWWSFFSRVAWRRRVAVVGILILVAVLGAVTLRFRGVSGDLVPQLEWRWSGSRVLEGSPVPEASIPAGFDYPQFLGPHRDGVIRGIRLARDWEADPPRLLWRQPVGTGWSGFAVAASRAVTQDQDGGRERVQARDLLTGRLLWSHEDLARFEEPISGAGPRATPAIAGGRVFTLGATGRLNALDLDSGELLWSRDLTVDLGARIPDYGFSGSPLVVGNRVIVVAGGPGGGSLAAYDTAGGEPVWSGGDDPAGYSSPALHRLNGRDQIVFLGGAHLVSHDPEDGRLLWSAEWPGQTQKVSQPVVLSGDRVFASSGYGTGGKLFRIEESADGGLKAEIVWASRALKAKLSNVVHRDGFLYGLDDGILVCVDLEDGRRRWKGGRYGHGQLILVDDLLLIQTERGGIALVEARPDAHRELGRLPVLDGKSWNHPALAGPYLVMRNDREAACLELPTRKE